MKHGTSAGGSLGEHDVVAGQVTYVGLFPVQLPYVRNKNGWNSTLTVRNNSGTYRAQVNITFFNRDGTVNYQRPTDYINARSLAAFGAPAGFDGSALVVSSEDVAVVAREESGTELNEYNGLMASTGNASLGWERAGRPVYVPFIKNHRNGRSSKILIANAGASPTYASVEFYDIATGIPMGNAGPYYLDTTGSYSVHADGCLSATGRCSAKITSSTSQPVAAIVLEQDDATTYSRATSMAFSSGGTYSFVPLVKKNFGTPSQTTGIIVQNIGTQSTTVSAICYDLNGLIYACGTQSNLAANATIIFGMPANMPTPFLGSAVVTSSGQPIVTLIYETGTPYQQVTNAPMVGTLIAYAPELYGNFSQSGQTWNSGLHVQNAGTAAANVIVTYYDLNGGQVGQWSSQIGVNLAWVLNCNRGNLPNNFRGSAVIQSSQPIVAMVTTNHTGAGDTYASYTVPNR